MTLNEKIAALEEISPQTIKGNFTFEEFKFEILEAMSKEPNYDKLLTIFYETNQFIDQEVYNIINERIGFKALYLNFALELDIDFVNALLCVEPLIKIDYELTKILKDNDFYNYMEETYWQHRRNSEFNFTQLTKMIQDIDFDSYIKEFQGGIEKLNELAK